MALGRLLRRLFLLACFALPIVAWFTYPPTRVLIPALAPITCGETRVCVDDLAEFSRAQELYDEALAFVNANIGQIENPPHMYFCSGQKCSDHFGWDGVAGYNVGTFGAVIKPSGWRKYIVRHEMIHHLQNERLGLLVGIQKDPAWFVEGMAYFLSEDPRRSFGQGGILAKQRAQFETWYAGVGPDKLWSEALKLTRQ